MSRGWEFDEVLDVCREAAAEGRRQAHAVMEHFDVDREKASKMISYTKRCNPEHGIPNDKKGPYKGDSCRYDRTEVARVAWETFRRGERLAPALSARFGMSESYAKTLLGMMRREGISVPFCPKAAHGPHLRAFGCPCDECQADTSEVAADDDVTPAPPVKVTVFGGGSIQLPEAALPMGPWVVDAACKGMPTNLFYPERGEPTKPALEVCKPCPVKAECLQYSIDNSERWGVWGGMTERQRRRIRSDRYQARRNAQ